MIEPVPRKVRTQRQRDESVDPYRLPPGPELDAMIHDRILGQPCGGNCPPYSTDADVIEKARKSIQTALGVTIIVGKTHLRRTPWFARYQHDASDATEVLAETYPLAVCRLALLKKLKG